MHVRRGDITRQGFTERQLENAKQFTPLSWFESMAWTVRGRDSLRSMPIVVFTDGSPEEVDALCRIEGVVLHRRATAITDLWTMSRAGILFASGFSTFSMWASFLGGMPTIYAPGKLQQRVQTARADAIEIELPAGLYIPEFVLERLAL